MLLELPAIVLGDVAYPCVGTAQSRSFPVFSEQGVVPGLDKMPVTCQGIGEPPFFHDRKGDAVGKAPRLIQSCLVDIPPFRRPEVGTDKDNLHPG